MQYAVATAIALLHYCTTAQQTKVFFDEPAAKIMVIDDFVSNDECDALIAATDGHMQVGDDLFLFICCSARQSCMLHSSTATQYTSLA
jgi:hypothetical protein